MCARTPRLLFTATLGAAIAVWAAHPLPIAGQASANSDEDRQLLGTWKLNLAKSKYKIGAPPRSQTRTYEPQGEGVKATISTTFSDGRSTTVGYVANYDSHTRSWHNQIPLDHPEWAAEMLSTLFEAARMHGTTIQVQAQPAGQGSPSRQAT